MILEEKEFYYSIKVVENVIHVKIVEDVDINDKIVSLWLSVESLKEFIDDLQGAVTHVLGNM